jgi:energy-converting hydrogenase A subunit R
MNAHAAQCKGPHRKADGGEAPRRIYVTDCEGPLTKNDNAQEIAERFMPDGAEFFARISKYDDYLVGVARKPGYNAGNTLRLIPPFLKAFSADDDAVERFSADGVLVVPGALEAVATIRALVPAFIISTSYTPYVKALCRLMDFPFENVRCTALSLDEWAMPPAESTWLRDWTSRVCARPIIDYPDEAVTDVRGAPDEAPDRPDIHDEGPWRSPKAALAWLGDEDRKTIRELDRLFWQEMREHPVSLALTESVRPVGGRLKLAALEEIVSLQRARGADVMYVGDSITDAPALAAVKAWGGVSLSFNGNGYALAVAEFAAASPDALIAAELAKAFAAGGRDAVVAAIRSRQRHDERDGSTEERTLRVGLNAEEPEALASASAAARRSVRGERIARLG